MNEWILDCLTAPKGYIEYSPGSGHWPHHVERNRDEEREELHDLHHCELRLWVMEEKKFRIIIFATKTAPERLSRPELVIQLLTSLTSLRSLKDFSLNYMHSMYSNSFSIPLRNHLRKNEYCQWISDAQTSTTLEFELESAFSPPFPKWLYFLVMGLLPMILLSILNWLIYRAISKARWVLIEK